MTRVPRRPLAILVAACLAACGPSAPDATPVPTTFPAAGPDAAVGLATDYLAAWTAGDYAAMHAMIDPSLAARYPLEGFVALHTSFVELAEVSSVAGAIGSARVVALPPEPRGPLFPAPSPTAVPTPDPSAAAASPSSELPASSIDPSLPVEGPRPALAVRIDISAESRRFGTLALERDLTFVQGPDGWLVRWSPELLFPELGAGGSLRLDRTLPQRGSIIGPDGLVWAETRDDGVRVYPQEALAGQTIGYVTAVTAEDLVSLDAEGYRSGDVIGRSGLESGAEELLRGTPGWTLVAVRQDGVESVVAATEAVPAADVAITLRPGIQLAAQQALETRPEGATAVVDPTSGDVWALASTPSFNPNAMTLGTTLGGIELPPPSQAQIFNKAVLAAYPAGSALKPFTLAAALQVGVVTPASTRTCPPTWQYNTITFHNFDDHTLPGQVGLAQSMAFSCNTTYMPLALEVYQAEETALTDMLFAFGFGAPTGIDHVVEEVGVVPDDAWLADHGRGGFTGFEQIQLAIGQGAFLGTPLQTASAFAAIGNGGTLWQARLVAAATLPDGTVVELVDPEPIRTIPLPESDLAFVTDTLEAVTTLSYGTATAAFAGFGIDVAGKSGTAENGSPDPHAWFPAYAPADAPTISVATVLPFIPLGTGGANAAPLVRQVMAAHFAGL